MLKTLLTTAMILLFAMSAPTFAQVVDPPDVSGVYVDPSGMVKAREIAGDASELAAQRLRAKAMNQPAQNGAITYISLKRLFAEVQTAAEQKKKLPDDIRYLSGATQLRYLFVYPEEDDIVLAGPSEAFTADPKGQPIGSVTGRPVMHLDDLVTALRSGVTQKQRPFGCSIDPDGDALAKSNEVMKQFAKASRGTRMEKLKEAMGPQKVTMFGLPRESRMAFITVAADYRLKRMCLGLESIPVAGVGSPVDDTRAAGNRFWFEASYLPLLVTGESDAYELRGPRLMLKAGAFSFDEKGATETARTFAKNFTARMPQLATTVPLYADLQNIADLSVIAALIRKDDLAKKAGLDLSWILNEANYKTAVYPTPQTAEVMVNFTHGSIVAGGVTFDPSGVVDEKSREIDKTQSLKPMKRRPEGTAWATTIGGEAAKAKK